MLVIGWPAVSAQNLAVNPGFESGLTGWSVSDGSASYGPDAGVRRSGALSAKGTETEAGSLGRLYQDVTGKLIPGQTYTLSGWIKTQGVTGSVVIAVDYVANGGWTPGDGYVREIGYVGGTQEWTFFQGTFTLPPRPSDASSLWLLIDFNAGTGTAWIDDIVLEPNSTKADLRCTITAFVNSIPGVSPFANTRDLWAVNLPAIVSLEVKNVGGVASPPVSAKLSLIKDISSYPLTEVGVEALQPGASARPRLISLVLPGGNAFDWNFFGDVKFRAEVDPARSIDETNTSNNVDTRTIVLVDPRPSRTIPATITIGPSNTIPNDFPTEHAAESVLLLMGYYSCEIPNVFNAGWTKDLTGAPIRSRRDGQNKSPSAFRGDAVIRPRNGRFVITFQGGPGLGEPNPCGFFHWDPNFINGYVATWHDIY
jgi:hypothetical protein